MPRRTIIRKKPKPKPKGVMGRPRNNPGVQTWYGASLRAVRMERGLHAQDLADAAGASLSSLYRWEQDLNAPSEKQVKKLAAALRVSPKVFGQSPKSRY